MWEVRGWGDRGRVMTNIKMAYERGAAEKGASGFDAGGWGVVLMSYMAVVV